MQSEVIEIMSNNKISIIIPTYNRGDFIGRAVKSVLEQDYNNIEVIIVDDCSTDNTEEVIRGLNDTRIKFIQHTQNKGANAARNTGIKAACGSFIAFQDSDDEWIPKKLSKQMKIFEESNDEKLGIVYTGFFKIQENRREYIPSKNIIKTSGNLHDVLLTTNFISTQSLLIKKECLLSVGLFDECLPRLQDWELLLRLSKQYHFYLVDEPLVNVYYTEGSISTNQKKLTETLTLILEKHYEDFAKDKKVLAGYYCYMGQQFYLLKDFKKMYHYCLEALKLDSLRLKFWLIIISFIFGKTLYKKIKVVSINLSKKFMIKRKCN